MRRCSQSDCGREVLARGLCGRHLNEQYRRARGIPPRQHKAMPFLRDAIQATTDDCIIWPFAVGENGYGACRQGTVHTIICEWAHGAKPTPQHEAAHSCGMRTCINRRHLRWATRLENIRENVERGTWAHGESHGFAKLTEDAVREIRGLSGQVKPALLAARFGVSRGTISDVQRHRSWPLVR